MSMYEDAEGTAVSRLMQIPQYVVLTAAEVMFSVTGLGFAYSQVCFSFFDSECNAITLGILLKVFSLREVSLTLRKLEISTGSNKPLGS